MLRLIFAPDKYARPEDQKRAERLSNGYAGPLPCEFEKKELGSPVIASLPTEQCYKMTSPERMTGLWSNAFEDPEFCPAPARECPDHPREAGKYPRLYPPFEPPHLPGDKDTPPGGLYAIDFIGRHTVYPLGSGELDKIVVVDRVISIKEVKPPPPGQMTSAHVAGYFAECDGKSICMPNSEAVEWRKQHGL